jgi:hypothetical protein
VCIDPKKREDGLYHTANLVWTSLLWLARCAIPLTTVFLKSTRLSVNEVFRLPISACEAELTNLLREVQQRVDVPIRGVISDGQHSIRKPVQAVLPDVPHQLCHFHYLREAAKPVYEADRHAKKELKKHLRGIRPIERTVEQRSDVEAEAIRGYCLAIRSALTDDGRPPLEAPGLKLNARIAAIGASLTRVSEKGAYRVS